MAHLCSDSFLSIFLRRDTEVFWRCLYYIDWQNWPIKPFTERTILENYPSGNVFRIEFCFTLTTGFIQIVIRTWFTDTILEPIIIVTTFMTIIVVVVFINLLFLFLLSPWLCWWSSCHYYWCWCDCHRYCCNFCNIVIITSLFFYF